MRIIFAGTPEVAVPTLRELHEAGHNILRVLTREDAPQGRKRTLTPSPVAVAAEELGLEIVKANRISEDTLEKLAASEADVGVIVAYGGLLREPVLSAPEHGWVNLHFSTLPKWRGAAPVQRAIMAGETDLGMTVFRLVEELDAGPILAQGSHTVASGTTAGTALKELSEAGTSLVLDALENIAHSRGQEQQGSTSYAHKLSRADGKLDVTWGTEHIVNVFAGVSPNPGAYFDTLAGALKIHDMRILHDAETADSEEVGTAKLVQNRVLLTVADGHIELLRVQPAGKPAMEAAAWLRGRGGVISLV